MRVSNGQRPYTAESRNGASEHVNGNGDSVTNADLLRVLEEMRDGITVPNTNAPNATMETAQGGAEDEAVRAQIGQMVMTIDKTKREIAAIKHPLSDDDPVVSASTQLDAIVDATEGATEDILDANEKIEDLVKRMVATDPDNGDLVGLGEEIGGHLVRMMEACSFQDITGQRVTKVVKTLSFIEERVAAIIGIWGPAAFESIPIDSSQPDEEKSDEQLLNGPQLENEGISQDDIDALFD